MKKYHYIIIEIIEHGDKHHVKLWAKFHKSRKREAKETYKNLRRHCSSYTTWVFVKVKEV